MQQCPTIAHTARTSTMHAGSAGAASPGSKSNADVDDHPDTRSIEIASFTCSLCSVDGIIFCNAVCSLCALRYGLPSVLKGVSKAAEEAICVCVCPDGCCCQEAGNKESLPTLRPHALLSDPNAHLWHSGRARSYAGPNVRQRRRTEGHGRCLKLQAEVMMHHRAGPRVQQQSRYLS